MRAGEALPRPPDAPALLARAKAAHHEGRLREALDLYEDALRLEPKTFETLFLQGALCLRLGDAARAARRLSRAVALGPTHAQAHLLLGAAHRILNRPYSALANFETAAKLAPNDPIARQHLGDTLRALRLPSEAIKAFDQCLALSADAPEVHAGRGAALADLRRHEEAIVDYDRALRLKPDFAAAHFNRGNALRALGRLEEAARAYEAAARCDPSLAVAHNNRGVALRELGLHAESVASFDAALAARPNYPEALNNRGASLRDLGRDDGALRDYEAALALKPDYREARRNLASLLLHLKHFEPALAAFDLAIHDEPTRCENHNGRAVALHALRRPIEALEALTLALAARPNDPSALGNRGVMLAELGRLDEAVADLEAAIRAQPADAAMLGRLGAILLEAGRVEEAARHLDEARKREPDNAIAAGAALSARMRLCDWRDFQRDREAVVAAIRTGHNALSPFSALALTDDPLIQAASARAWIKAEVAAPERRERAPTAPRGPKLRIGYLSADFRGHAMANLMLDVFASHDRARFEIFAFKLGGVDDAMTTSLRGCFDHFVDLTAMSDAAAAETCREAGLDIAVDLMGLTRGSRASLFARGLAPVHIGFLGYPGPMGADLIDYVIADEIVIPESARSAFDEKVIYLPDGYYPTSHRKLAASPPPTPSRSSLRLPDNGFVFGCFNNAQKINPACFDIWMELLRRVDGSVIWLLGERASTSDNLRKEARARGVDPARLVFAPKAPWLEHMARHRAADLFLDTLPYNAHTTAVDALWMGLPVLTQVGRSFAGRVAASLLTRMDAPELITDSSAAYLSMALALATEPDRLAKLRAKLARQRLQSPLFDAARFARSLEAAYAAAAERSRSGLTPADIRVVAG